MGLDSINPGWLLVLVFFALIALRVPIAFALGLSSLLVLHVTGMGFSMVADLFFSNVAKFSLLAIPFFILAGVIMGEVGVAHRIVRFVELLVGNITGGMAVVAILVALFWGAVSGSGPAAVAAIGPFLIAGMDRAGYDRGFATGLTATAAALAIVIPPSIAFVVYGILAEVSIARLFIGGIIPGALVGLALIIWSLIASHREGMRGGARGTPQELWEAFKDAFWGLMAPVIILGGIYGGVFTPTEAAIVGVIYGLFVGLVIYRSLTVDKLFRLLVEASVSSAVVMAVVAFAGLFGWVMAIYGVVEQFSQALLAVSNNPLVIILMINIILLVAGMLMDAITIMYISLPVLLPVVRYFEWDPLWFGIMMTVNLAIGLVTPPVGINLYVAANVAGLDLNRVIARTVPFIMACLVALAVISYFPGVSLWLPNWVMPPR